MPSVPVTRIHSASASSPSRMMTVPAGTSCSTAGFANLSSTELLAPVKRSSAPSNRTRGASRATAAADSRSAFNTAGRPTNANSGKANPITSSVVCRPLDVSNAAPTKLAADDEPEDDRIEHAKHAAEDFARQVALQCRVREHVDDDHPGARDHLQDERQDGGVHGRGDGEGQCLQHDAAEDDRRKAARTAELVRETGGKYAAESGSGKQVAVPVRPRSEVF